MPIGINTNESGRADSEPISGKNGTIAQEVEAATPPQMGLPPVSEGVKPEDVPQPDSITPAPAENVPETVPPTLADTAAKDTENPSAVAQEVATQQTPDIPAPQENTEPPVEPSTTPETPTPESVSPPETGSAEPSTDSKSIDGVGAPKEEKINPHNMEPHDLEATVGISDEKSDVQEGPTQPVPPPVPEDSNAQSSESPVSPTEVTAPEGASTPSFVPQENVVSPPIPETITPGETAQEPANPEEEKGEPVTSILERIKRRNDEQSDDIDELKRRMQSSETLNQEAA